MASVALICDSTADINQSQRKELGIRVVPLNIHFGNEVLQDYIDIDPAGFLARLATTTEMPRTSQPSPAIFTEAYNQELANHETVLVLTISASLSGTYQSALLGATTCNRPEAVRIVDSRSASIGLNLQVRRALALIDRELDLEEIAITLESETDRYHLIFFADTLDFLQRGGRIGRAGHLVGSLLKIKPLLRCESGEVVAYERTRSRARAIEGLIDYARLQPSITALSILHDGTEDEDVETISSALADLYPRERMIITQYGPIIATHVGPKALGVCICEGGPSS